MRRLLSHLARESLLGQLVVRCSDTVEVTEPSARLLRWKLARSRPRKIVLTCVYRERNAAIVGDLIETLPSDTEIHLWALDAPASRLQRYTRGTGPGARMEIHQKLLQNSPVEEDAYWIICDDDIRLSKNGIDVLVKAAAEYNLDVLAPSHSWSSFFNHPITLKKPFSWIRITHFVEIGPLVVMSPKAQRCLLPFPKTTMAGWGFEVYWSSLVQPTIRCAIVDGVSVVHMQRMGSAYNSVEEYRLGIDFAQSYGVNHVDDLKLVLQTWRPGKGVPPWSVSK